VNEGRGTNELNFIKERRKQKCSWGILKWFFKWRTWIVNFKQTLCWKPFLKNRLRNDWSIIFTVRWIRKINTSWTTDCTHRIRFWSKRI